MSCRGKSWITPFLKQCFAVSSVTFNILSYGMVMGFNASLFSELKKTQEILLDRSSESWLASLIGITTLIGSLFTAVIIDNIGRKPAVIISSALMICGWTAFSLATSLPVLLIAKFLQGISVGLGMAMGGILIAEYSSPKYRGPFMATVPAASLFGVFIAHLLGLFYNWRKLSIILLFCSTPGLIIAMFTPESPSFLATKGRYEECRKIFRWLRGRDEEDELEKMIKADMLVKEANKDHRSRAIRLINEKLTYGLTSFKKREFRIPVFIVMHLNAINPFCGSIINDTYTFDIHKTLYGTDTYMFQVIASLDIQRILSSVLAIYLTSKFRRRPLLFTLVGLNILVYTCEAGYMYARRHSLLPIDHISIGIFLHHLHYFTNGAGSMSLTAIISNELYPIADRGYCCMICSIFFSTYLFINLKSAPYLFSAVGIEGAFCVYAVVLLYLVVVLYFTLPETKDKTLQEVEDVFRGYSVAERAQSLNLVKTVC